MTALPTSNMTWCVLVADETQMSQRLLLHDRNDALTGLA